MEPRRSGKPYAGREAGRGHNGARDGGSSLRLNPFAFPSETDFRFVLLVVSVVGSSLLLYSLVFETFPATAEYKRTQYAHCRELADPDDLTGSFAELTDRIWTHAECTASVDASQAGWMLGGVGLLLAVAGLIYWTYPQRKIRSDSLVPLNAADAPEAVAYVAELCREAGLDRSPILMWSPLDQPPTGVVFGRLGRYYLALTGGLVRLFYRDQPRFRAVALHELAHLRNADVDKTYLAVAVAEAFLVAAALPFIASQAVFSPSLEEVGTVGWRIVPLLVLVYLTRNAVLRARELYADVRASVWDGPSGALAGALEDLARATGRVRLAALRVHPDPVERRGVLDDTRPLFGMSVWEACAVGAAAGVAFPNVVLLLHLLVPLPQVYLRLLTPALIFAPLVVGVVGLGVWRATFAARAGGAGGQRAGRLGLGVGVGFAVGQQLSFAAAVPLLGDMPLANWTALGLEVLWMAVISVCLALFLRWVAAGASTWLQVPTDRPPRTAYRIGLTLGGGLLAAWLALVFLPYVALGRSGAALSSPAIQDALSTLQQSWSNATEPQRAMPGPLAEAAGVVLLSINALVVVTLVISWAFPLAAWLWRNGSAAAHTPHWALLDPPASPVPLPRPTPLRPGVAVLVGVSGGIGFWILSLLVHRALFDAFGDTAVGQLIATLDLPTPDATLQEKIVFLIWGWTVIGQVVLAAGIQCGVGFLVGVWVRRNPVVHALFAAFLAGTVMALGAVGLAVVFLETGGDLPTMGLLANLLLVGGGFLGLPLVLGASALAGTLRRLVPFPRPAPLYLA